MATITNFPHSTPVKAQGLYTFTVAIPDDDFVSFTPAGSSGFMFMTSTGTSNNAQIWYRTNATIGVYLGANIEALDNIVLDGTTGTDTKASVSAAGGLLYVENRLGSELTITVTLLCANDTAEP